MAYAEIDDRLILTEGSSVGFALEILSGWQTPAPPRVKLNLRPQAHGSFSPGVTYRDTKIVTVAGSFTGDTIEQAYAAMEQIAGLGSDGDSFTLRYVNELGAKTMTVWLANAPDLPDVLWTPYFRFAFEVVAIDPRKYDDASPVSTELPSAAGGASWPVGWPVSWGAVGSLGRVTSTNMGTAPSVPLFQISGGLPNGFLLAEVGTGQEVRFEGAIPLGSTLYLNPRTGSASLDNQADRSGLLTRSEWWSVPPGGTSSVQFTTLGAVVGTPLLTVLFASANW